jgi:hypothetical protein
MMFIFQNANVYIKFKHVWKNLLNLVALSVNLGTQHQIWMPLTSRGPNVVFVIQIAEIYIEFEHV